MGVKRLKNLVGLSEKRLRHVHGRRSMAIFHGRFLDEVINPACGLSYDKLAAKSSRAASVSFSEGFTKIAGILKPAGA